VSNGDVSSGSRVAGRAAAGADTAALAACPPAEATFVVLPDRSGMTAGGLGTAGFGGAWGVAEGAAGGVARGSSAIQDYPITLSASSAAFLTLKDRSF